MSPRLTIGVALLAAVVGCQPPEWDETYGRRRGSGGRSLAGTAALGAMFEQAGCRVSSWQRISPRLNDYQVVVWAPDDFAAPAIEARQRLEQWLLAERSRTLIYVGRDHDAASAYWRFVVQRARDTQHAQAWQRQSRARAVHEGKRSSAPLRQYARWFTLDRDQPPTKVTMLDSPSGWDEGVDVAALDIRVETRLNVATTADLPAAANSLAEAEMLPSDWERLSQEARDRRLPNTQVLLNSNAGPLVTQVTDDTWPASQVLVVANGSFVLNLGLVNHEHRKLAQRLIDACLPADEVLFLESGPQGVEVYDQDPEDGEATGLELFTVWPIGLVMIHLLGLGVLACFSMYPLFGRPRDPPSAGASDFGRHVAAVGKLLAEANAYEFVVARLQQYHQHVKRDSGPANAAEEPPPTIEILIGRDAALIPRLRRRQQFTHELESHLASMNNPTSALSSFHCQSCQRLLQVPSDSAGRSAKCPQCGAVQLIPASAGQTPLQDLVPIVPQSPQPPVASQPSAAAAAMASPQPLSEADQEDIAAIADPRIHREGEAPAEPRSRPPARETPTKQLFDRIIKEIEKIYVGQDELVLGALVALFSSGHVLIESVPGLGKTLLVRTLGRVLGCEFGRIQFTADLMPSDITGAPIFDMKLQEFRFRPGPVFTQLLLGDEINRSPAKTHAALLEIMQEYRVTVDGVGHELQRPFLVLATQNPIESEGTYNLPEAQLDRFMFKLRADYPQEDQEAEILRLHSQQVDLDDQLAEVQQVTGPAEIQQITKANSQVHVDDRLLHYINQLVRLTRQWPQFHMGASPRAGIALMQASRTLAAFSGRDYAVPDDVVSIALPALRHRVILNAEAEVEGRHVDDLLNELIRRVEVPRI